MESPRPPCCTSIGTVEQNVTPSRIALLLYPGMPAARRRLVPRIALGRFLDLVRTGHGSEGSVPIDLAGT